MSQGKQRRGVKISEDVDEGDGPRRECSRATPRSATDLPILSVMEGELVTIVKKVPGYKLWYPPCPPPHAPNARSLSAPALITANRGDRVHGA
jgi:hypothetical protein